MTTMTEVFCQKEQVGPAEYVSNAYTLAFFTQKKKDHEINEDSSGFIMMPDGRTILIIADGLGGHAQGEVASKIAVKTLVSEISKLKDSFDDTECRNAILNGFEEANNKVLALNCGAGTTLLVIEFTSDWLRYYCAGDSVLEVIGGRGKKKYRSIGHSSFDMAVEAGVIEDDADDIEQDDLRNTVTNLVGSRDMRIEIGSKYPLDPRDIIIAGTDGMFDNVVPDQSLKNIKSKSPMKVCTRLALDATNQMYNPPSDDSYSKPDDVSIFVVMKSDAFAQDSEDSEAASS